MLRIALREDRSGLVDDAQPDKGRKDLAPIASMDLSVAGVDIQVDAEVEEAVRW